MIKKTTVFSVLGTFFMCCLGISIVVGNTQMHAIGTKATTYSFDFTSSKNKLDVSTSSSSLSSGSGIITNTRGNEFELTYHNVYTDNTCWLALSNTTSYVDNINCPINGMTALRISVNGATGMGNQKGLYIYYSNEPYFSQNLRQSVVFSNKNVYNFYFAPGYNESEANYFRITSSGTLDTKIISMTIEYGCVDHSKQLTVISNNEEWGTVYTEFSRHIPGKSAQITATPNSGYMFVGWYLNDELVTFDASYAYTMPETDTTLLGMFEPIPVI